MKISEQFGQGRPLFSFEFFPPKTEDGERALFRTIEQLQPLQPDFVSVTYGAGGSTRHKTIDLVCLIRRSCGIEAMAHLTCVDSRQEEIRDVLEQLKSGGVENILALRGDPPQGKARFEPLAGGFAHASELVEFVRDFDPSFCVGGAAYPEGHVEAPDLETDLAWFDVKVRAGLSFAVTQLFFENRHYFSFVTRAREKGITLPIVPGIMPITNVAQLDRFTRLCGATIPAALRNRLQQVAGDDEAIRRVGIEHALVQCRELLAEGAPGIHFYTLNQSPSTRAVLEELKA